MKSKSPAAKAPASIPVDAAPPVAAKRKKTGKLTPLGHAGEGSYSGSKDYAESVSKYLATADVEADARKAAPTTIAEANALAAAERAARNHGPVMRKKYPFPT